MSRLFTGSEGAGFRLAVAGHDPRRPLIVTDDIGHSVAIEQPELVEETIRQVPL